MHTVVFSVISIHIITLCFVALIPLSCALKELETLGKELYGAKLILQRFQVRRCPHFKSPVSASECLLSMLDKTNPHHYFVATQVRNMWSYTLLFVLFKGVSAKNKMYVIEDCRNSHLHTLYLGLHSHYRTKEHPWGSSALHHPQHHRSGQTQSVVTGPRAGRSAGGTGEPGPAAEHPQPERGARNQQEGRREARKKEEKETEQP